MRGDPLLLAREHEAALAGGPAPGTRPVILESWRRSLAARVDPDSREAPLVLDRDEVVDLRAAHPLAQALPVLRETLVSIADDAEHVMIITDADGRVLWCEGSARVRGVAERVRLTEGARWSEDAIGTNAMGLALATGGPVTVHSAEHLVRTCHGWTCAASPVTDPDSGRTLGVVDVSGPLTSLHPAMPALVSAAARLAEGHLRTRLAERDERLRSANMRHLLALRGGPGALLSQTGRVLAAEPGTELSGRVDVGRDRVRLADGRTGVLEPLDEGYLLRVERGARRRPVLSLRFLGEPTAALDGDEVALTLRHAEVLVALALHPRGLTADQLALRLYGERGNPVTVRAELHRLRAQLGGVLLTRPYRLDAEVRGDFLAVRAALRSGDVTTAASGYGDELLPRSDAPVVRAEREDLAAAVRRTVLDRGDAEALWRFARDEDAEALDRLARLLPRADPRRELVVSRLRRVLAEA
ncbi:GAF domain-containing protein [Actinosynnema pretiosum subsp. pretiosum]|uniref:GAF domain-containing protein n=1 Tax=Actinosynnema pretiosum subsp. pretiosum TaxID=103721 RepID=A0AA45R6N6_9PSEU|nr:putative GAF sensor protein [Actinosynnema pretiosum subsp. pretiosum]QUF07231.1 GAF domain-containing protein [Actinosynnema pretiosum subsp. pretiosum]